MVESPENLTLVYLRRMDANIVALRDDTREIKHRQNEMARQLASLRRDQGSDAESVAHLQTRMDAMREEMDRIKRRLDIID